ncbi:hypothetical protein [Lacihabitans soyangensis]|uniref:Uncharacterized protein n=1 Tax=Lacihabitans soyangensis TaxID=869394 RepID=A0AAE3H6J3_9BACT|nr:hypothetical protein [Lacihabitans soyangensis]MCP9765663.1 hypothetical protein [Lacihabitans soyangensis]
MKRKKFRNSFLFLTILFSLFLVTPTYAKWFGWESNNDCVPVATPDDSHNVSACIGGTETFYLFGIAITTRSEKEKYGYVG